MAEVIGTSPDPARAGVEDDNTANGPGVWGSANPSGRGVVGVSSASAGVWGATATGRAVVGAADTSGAGVWGESQTGTGVVGVSRQGRGVSAGSQTNTGVYAAGRVNAGYFDGNVHVQGDISVSGDIFIQGADYAEQLTASGPVDPGTVVVLDGEGEVKPCAQHHDRRVPGIVSGAQGVRPAFVLDRHEGGAPIALLGKAWCRADATEAPIRPGDLLTTSSTPGHARRADDEPAPGTVIGKALTPLPAGRGWVHVFVCRA